MRQILGKNKEPMGVVGSLKKKGTVGKREKPAVQRSRTLFHATAMWLLSLSRPQLSQRWIIPFSLKEKAVREKRFWLRQSTTAVPRKNKPFIAINCAALPRELIQSELFGYEQGTFTGANRGGKAGKFELAEGGTIFLDEIGDMPLEAQANLLRVLQEKSITRIGGFTFRSGRCQGRCRNEQGFTEAVEGWSFPGGSLLSYRGHQSEYSAASSAS